MNEPTNILDEVIGELSAIPTIKPDTSMPAKEPHETLEQLTNAWQNEKTKSAAPTFPTNRPKYDESAKPFLKKEELYPYWQSGAVTTPYIIMAIENAGNYVGLCEMRTMGYGRFAAAVDEVEFAA